MHHNYDNTRLRSLENWPRDFTKKCLPFLKVVKSSYVVFHYQELVAKTCNATCNATVITVNATDMGRTASKEFWQ